MGRRGRPPKRPASATSSAEQHMKRVRDICLNSRFVNIGENGKKWQQHRRACEGSQPGFDFVGHLLSLHDVHCSRAPPENVDVKLEVDDEALHGDNGSLDVVQVSLDGDLARQWRHLQKMAGYEAAEMEYLCWLMTVAEQMLGWKSQSEEKDNDDRAEEEDEDYTPEPPRQRRRRTEPTPATAGTSFDSPVYETPTELPEYGLHSGDDSNSGSGGVPGGSRHADSEEEQEDVKPEIEPAQGTLTKFTIKWADKPSTSTAPTSIETETTRFVLGSDSEKKLLSETSSGRQKSTTSTQSKPDKSISIHSEVVGNAIGDKTDSTPPESKSNTMKDTGNAHCESSEIKPVEGSEGCEDLSKDQEEDFTSIADSKLLSGHASFIYENAKYFSETYESDKKPDVDTAKLTEVHASEFGTTFYCKSCEKGFKSKEFLQLHHHRCHGAELPPKMWKCLKCSKHFLTNTELNMHEHHDHRVSCILCGSSMGRDRLEHHMKSIHPNCEASNVLFTNTQETKNIKYYCKACNRHFETEYQLDFHNYYYHGGKPVDLKKNNPHCIFCNKAFLDVDYLEKHLQSLHGIIDLETYYRDCEAMHQVS